MTGNDDNRGEGSKPPSPTLSQFPGVKEPPLAHNSQELESIDSAWPPAVTTPPSDAPTLPPRAQTPALQGNPPERSALASTLPPPEAVGITLPRMVQIEFGDGPGTSALELADMHAVRKPSLVAAKPAMAPLPDVPPVTSVEDALRVVKDKIAMGDFTGALTLASGILDAEPEHVEAARYARHSENVLIQMYSARLGALSQVVALRVDPAQVRWLSLDHRAGFLLSLIDGNLSLEQLLDISGMPHLDALRILHGLFEQQIILLSPAS
ncbi:MAG: hypothetical protein SFV15_15210 [Polyangiaceae bacterium]|nr:hypothetical protein [Polyangiaceae bacterium]